MSEHTWTLEHIEAYLAGGLEAAESLRLESHVHECPPCADALERSRQLDLGLSALFAVAHPGADLEDRSIRALRTGRERMPVAVGWRKRILVAAGVAAVLAGGGYIGTQLKDMPMPGGFAPWQVAKRNETPGESLREAATDGVHSSIAGLPPGLEGQGVTNEDLGPQSKIQLALPDLDRVDKQTVDAAVSKDNLGQPSVPATDTTAVKLRYLSSSDSRGYGNNPGQDGSVVRGTSRTVSPSEGFLQPTYANPYYKFNLGVPGQDRGQESRERFGYEKALPQKESPRWEKMAPSSERLGDQSDGEKKYGLGFKAATPEPGLTVAPPVEPGSAAPTPAEAGPRNIVIRSGEIEFIIDSFDAASATVTKLIGGIKGAFISTINSDKLVNGKVKGSITVRVPPEHLDGLILDLRKELGKGGELKGVRIGSQDITKQYTDLESRLKAARTMEQRLLQIIKEGKGEIKQLLEAEKELGVWRTRIEEIEGELRYYSNMVSLSTLTISLTEKELRAAADIRESERVQGGLEVEDVDKTYQQLLSLIAELKGRVTKSDMKQLSAGQFSATLHFEVAPEQGGPVRDRLRQLGRLARLEIDRVQRPEGAVTKNAKLERGDTEFFLQIYNLANIAPRETAIIHVAVSDVPAAFRALRETIARSSGRVLMAQLNENDLQNISAQFDFDVPRTAEEVAKSTIDTLGEVVARQLTRAPEGENVTDAKVLHKVTLVGASSLKPREQTILSLEVADVDQTVALLRAEADEAKARLVDSQFARDRNGQRSARLIYEVPLVLATGLVEQFKKGGAVRIYQSTRDPRATNGKFAVARLELTLVSAQQIVNADEGLWPKVRQGLSYSASVLLSSVTYLVFGLCVVLPWAILAFVVFRLIRWMVRTNRPASPISSMPTEG